MGKIFKDKDGEFRLYDGSGSTGPYYISILFTNGDFTFPIARGRPEEILTLDRQNLDSNAHYSEGSDEPLLAPVAFSGSVKLDDTVNTSYLVDWLSGVTIINSKSLTTTKGTSSVTVSSGSAVSTPAFSDDQKITYDCELLWDGTTDLGYKLKEIYFQPDQQTIAESQDAVTLNINGLIYGSISRISAFNSGTTIQT